MIRSVALFASLSLLTGCATHSASPPAETPAPKAADARLCAPLKPEPAFAGSIVQPESNTPEASATAAFLDYVAAALDWGRQGWGRAEIAKSAC